AGRNRREIEDLIGFFVNTLVIRVRLEDTGADGPSFAALLAQVRETALGAFTHQDLPFERLVEELVPERQLSHSPLFQAAFALQNAPGERLSVPDLSLTLEGLENEIAKFDLSLILWQEGAGFAGALEHNTDLFDATTAERLVARFTALLEAAIGDPGVAVGELPLLAEAERHQALVEWNDTAGSQSPDLLMHQLFAAQAEARPDDLAAVWEENAWTYRELAERAHRLASFLRHLDVKRGTAVGVWMDRSLDMLAGVLGILEAGGTYVPLDAAWPADRVETILAGASAPVILCSRRTLPAVEKLRWGLPRLGDAICLDVETTEPAPETVDTAAIRSLFDFVSDRATDRVTAGGFVSRRTGLPFLEAEVDEYRDRVLSLAEPWLRPGARVLEVGCGSGLILWEMARRVERAVGLDPSEHTQERNREHARAAGIDNVELPTGFADEIGERFAPGSFDLVLLASTVQFFPGPRYLEKVVADALALLAPGGALLLADVIDARKDPAAPNTATNTLTLDEELFHDLGRAEIHHRTEGFANELGERYDVILQAGETKRKKRTWTGWHVE
ncbi:MAG TPA: condensation domain-containing protein, partial [Thermoanaerobaculia bacterium]